MSGPSRPVLRSRLYVDGQVVHEVWFTMDTPEEEAGQVAERQKELADKASDADLPWHVELYDPDAPPGTPAIRFGTDGRFILNPEPMPDTPTGLLDYVREHPYARWLLQEQTGDNGAGDGDPPRRT